MKKLDYLEPSSRLFTYKVAHDGGSAPNPEHGVCTLAICKPAIRRVAKINDVIVGLACVSDNESRIIYGMVVEHSIPWDDYIKICNGTGKVLAGINTKKIRSKIPKNENDTGDCIWKNANNYVPALESWSTHNGNDQFNTDVLNGKKVLLSTKFWYFGKGDKHKICLNTDGLRQLIPGRGHRSNSNKNFRNEFVDFFNHAMALNNIRNYGIHGTPSLAPDLFHTPESVISS